MTPTLKKSTILLKRSIYRHKSPGSYIRGAMGQICTWCLKDSPNKLQCSLEAVITVIWKILWTQCKSAMIGNLLGAWSQNAPYFNGLSYQERHRIQVAPTMVSNQALSSRISCSTFVRWKNYYFLIHLLWGLNINRVNWKCTQYDSLS